VLKSTIIVFKLVAGRQEKTRKIERMHAMNGWNLYNMVCVTEQLTSTLV